MIIKSVGELKRMISDIPDEYSLEFRVRTKIPDEELKDMRYPYPYNTEYLDGVEFDDVGHSDKVLCLGVTLGINPPKP